MGDQLDRDFLAERLHLDVARGIDLVDPEF
jgi:hypothetical protein